MEKVDLSKGYWNPQRKLALTMHFPRYREVALNLKHKSWCQQFFSKKEKTVFFTDFPQLQKIQKTQIKPNTFRKIFEL